MSALPAAPPAALFAAPAHWRAIDLIADLHLKPEEPDTCAAWRDYLARLTSARADALFILGDLFEAWLGDDAILPGSFEADCVQALHEASRRLSLYFMPGNRDFLVGADCLSAARMQPLTDPTALHFGAGVYLLSHGDLLCTGDAAYQRERALVRTPEWMRHTLARPLTERQALARQMRAQSRTHQAAQQRYAEVDSAAALGWLDAARAATLIHGHTHRPADHSLTADAQGGARWRRVLSDWHITATERRAQVLRLHRDGRIERLPP